MKAQIIVGLMALALVGGHADAAHRARSAGLWSIYTQTLAHAKYIDLTHTITPNAPVWHGFGPSHFAPTVNPETSKPYLQG